MSEVPDGSIELYYDKSNIDAVCVNCNKRLKSMRAISMHLKITATRHAVDIIDYGKYDKKTGLTTSRNSETKLLQNHIAT